MVQLQQMKKNILVTLGKNGGSINFAKLHDKYSDNFKLLWNALEKLVEEEKIENPFNYVIEEEDKVIFNGTKIQIKN